MGANGEFIRVKEWAMMRGFANLYQKESRAWWNTRRWWVNGLLWLVLIGGPIIFMIYGLPALAAVTGGSLEKETGGPLVRGLQGFFEVGGMAITIGVIILCQGLVIDEKQTGLVEWIMAKPVQRKAYVLAKLCSSLVVILVLLIALPGAAAYGLLFLRGGEPFPLQPFIAGTAVLVLHSLFYMTLTIMLGTFFNSRSPILGITFGIYFAGMFMFKPFVYVGPWMLAKFSTPIANSISLPPDLLWPPLIATLVWCVVFTCAALIKFERTEL
jgi:ABC-2 type transport system permease protein